MDLDGDVDLITREVTSDTISILSNLGGGAFARSILFGPVDPAALTLADMDNNGLLDIVVAAYASPHGFQILPAYYR